MKATEFCYWLQGYFEIAGEKLNYGEVTLHADQVATIRRHLAMVFVHNIDPSYPKEQQQALNDLHKPKIGGKDPVTGAIMRC